MGVAHATYMESKDLSLSEYLEFLKTKTPSKPVGLSNGYKAYYIAGDATQVVPDSEKYDYTVSSDNMGGMIVTYVLKNK